LHFCPLENHLMLVNLKVATTSNDIPVVCRVDLNFRDRSVRSVPPVEGGS
jgi:hypothetical protein